jgi:hypothetical protein
LFPSWRGYPRGSTEIGAGRGAELAFEHGGEGASSLSDLKNRSVVGLAGKPHSGCSQNSAGRGRILTISPGNSHSIAQESDEIWIGQADLQPIYFKSDRLLGYGK